MRQYVVFALVAPALAALAGCATVPVECLAVMEIPRMEEAITVDGLLEESCYRSHPPLQQFVVAGNAAQAALTRVWLFWNEDRPYAPLPVRRQRSPRCRPPQMKRKWTGRTGLRFLSGRAAISPYIIA